jgi:hypothetical protein
MIGEKTSTSNHKNAESLNVITFNDYYSRLRLLALSMFEWINVPEAISTRYIERTLFSEGRILFFRDPKLNYMCLKCTPIGFNVYDEPIEYNAISRDYNKKYSNDEAVLIRNNIDETPTNLTIELFAMRLSDVEMTASVNISAQKTPILITCNDKERMTMKNVYKEYTGNQPVIYGFKGTDFESFKVLKTDAPYLGDKLMTYKHNIWNEALTFLGIKNTNIDKKERLNSDEVNANNQLVTFSAETMLASRKEACKKINDMFGLKIDVKLRDCFEGGELSIE